MIWRSKKARGSRATVHILQHARRYQIIAEAALDASKDNVHDSKAEKRNNDRKSEVRAFNDAYRETVKSSTARTQ